MPLPSPPMIPHCRTVTMMEPMTKTAMRNGTYPISTIIKRRCIGQSIATVLLLCNNSVIFILHMICGENRPAPHLQISARQRLGAGLSVTRNLPKVDPRHRRMEMVSQMPSMVEPQQVENRPVAQIFRAAKNVATRAVMVNVLQC